MPFDHVSIVSCKDTVFAMDTSDSSDSDELIPGDGDQCCAT